MFDIGDGKSGTQILLASSSDDNYPPENILDGKQETFWATTGLFPQEFIVKFSSISNIERVKISTYNVKKMVVETTESETPEKFEEVATKEFDCMDHQLQNEEFSVKESRAQCMRFVIESGYDHFVSVHTLKVSGNALHA